MNRTPTLLLAVSSLFFACAPRQPTLGFAVASPAAVGVNQVGTLAGCGYIEYERQGCEPLETQIHAAEFSDPDMFTIDEVTHHLVRFRATKAGTGTITVDGSGGLMRETFVVPVEAVAIDHVGTGFYRGPCIGTRAPGPHKVSTNAVIEMGYDISGGGRQLHGFTNMKDLFLTDVGTVEDRPLLLSAQLANPWRLTVRSTAGLGTVTSPFDPTLAFPIDVYEPSQVTAIELNESSPAKISRYNRQAMLTMTVKVGTEPSCADALPVHLSVQTPDKCQMKGSVNTGPGSGQEADYPSTSAGFGIDGLAVGTCRIIATVPGTQLTATREFTIVE